MTELTLTSRRHIKATPKAVYEAWLTPEVLRKFMIPRAGTTLSRAEVDARKGGRYHITMTAGEGEIPITGTYLELVPHSRIAFTWESSFSVDGSIVTLDFQPADGGTDVTLTHVKFADEQARDNHKGGWDNILDCLSGAVK